MERVRANSKSLGEEEDGREGEVLLCENCMAWKRNKRYE
jgi:hypothetical protein